MIHMHTGTEIEKEQTKIDSTVVNATRGSLVRSSMQQNRQLGVDEVMVKWSMSRIGYPYLNNLVWSSAANKDKVVVKQSGGPYVG